MPPESVSLSNNRPGRDGPVNSPFSPFCTTGEGLRGEESRALCKTNRDRRDYYFTLLLNPLHEVKSILFIQHHYNKVVSRRFTYRAGLDHTIKIHDKYKNKIYLK